MSAPWWPRCRRARCRPPVGCVIHGNGTLGFPLASWTWRVDVSGGQWCCLWWRRCPATGLLGWCMRLRLRPSPLWCQAAPMLQFVALEAGTIFFSCTWQLAMGTVVAPVHSWKDRKVRWGVLKVKCLVGSRMGGFLFLVTVNDQSGLDAFARATGLAMSPWLPVPSTTMTTTTYSDFLTPCCLWWANLIITHLICPSLPLIHRLCHFTIHLGVLRFCWNNSTILRLLTVVGPWTISDLLQWALMVFKVK